MGHPWENTGEQGCSLGLQWGAWESSGAHCHVLGHTGMPWSFVAMGGEGLGPAELVIPTAALFTRPSLSAPCRETMRPHWSLGCPSPSKGWEDQSALQFPRLDALQVHPTTHIQERTSTCFQKCSWKCLRRKRKGLVWIGDKWGCGWGTGVPSCPRPVASPSSEHEKSLLIPPASFLRVSPGIPVHAGTRAWVGHKDNMGIWGLQGGRWLGGDPETGHWGELAEPKGPGWGCWRDRTAWGASEGEKNSSGGDTGISSEVVGGGRRKRTAEDRNDGIGKVFGRRCSRKGIWGHYRSGQDERQRTEGKDGKKGIGTPQREGIWGGSLYRTQRRS